MDGDKTRGQGYNDDVRGQGLTSHDVRGQGPVTDETRGQGYTDDVQGQGLITHDVRGQGLVTDGTRGQGYIEDVRGRGLISHDVRGQGLVTDGTRGQGYTDDVRGQGLISHDVRGQGLVTDGTRGQGCTDDVRGQGLISHDIRRQGLITEGTGGHRSPSNETLSRRFQADNAGYSQRRGRSSKRRRKRRNNYSSTSSESSGESIRTRSKSKRLKSHKYSTNVILDKVLSIVRDVRSSDKHRLSFDKNVIPEFDPMTKEQTILTWITKVEESAEIYSWDEREIIHYALPKLAGLAKSWYQGLPSLLHTWSEWKKKLIESFPCREDYAELLTEMLGKRVRYGESLEHFYYAKVNLLNRCRLTGRQAVDCILHGVDDRAVRIGAQAAQFTEPEQVLKYFRTIKIANTRDHNDQSRKNKTDRYAGPSNNRTVQNKPVSSNSNIRCFNCNQQGHPSFKCDKPLVKCTKCDRIGHQSANCYTKPDNPSNKSQNEKQVSEVSTSDNSNHKYIMDIKVNDVVLKCHLDSIK